jgi:hypothetical protein
MSLYKSDPTGEIAEGSPISSIKSWYHSATTSGIQTVTFGDGGSTASTGQDLAILVNTHDVYYLAFSVNLTTFKMYLSRPYYEGPSSKMDVVTPCMLNSQAQKQSFSFFGTKSAPYDQGVDNDADYDAGSEVSGLPTSITRTMIDPGYLSTSLGATYSPIIRVLYHPYEQITS